MTAVVQIKQVNVIYSYKYLQVLDWIEDLMWPNWNSSLVTLFKLRVIPAQSAVHVSYKYSITVCIRRQREKDFRSKRTQNGMI